MARLSSWGVVNYDQLVDFQTLWQFYISWQIIFHWINKKWKGLFNLFFTFFVSNTALFVFPSVYDSETIFPPVKNVFMVSILWSSSWYDFFYIFSEKFVTTFYDRFLWLFYCNFQVFNSVSVQTIEFDTFSVICTENEVFEHFLWTDLILT